MGLQAYFRELAVAVQAGNSSSKTRTPRAFSILARPRRVRVVPHAKFLKAPTVNPVRIERSAKVIPRFARTKKSFVVFRVITNYQNPVFGLLQAHSCFLGMEFVLSLREQKDTGASA